MGAFFSKTAVAAIAPMIYTKMDLLELRLREQLAKDGVAEMRKNFLATTTDVLCDHAFYESLDLLRSDQAAGDWQKTIKAVAGLTPLQKQFLWIVPTALKLPLLPLWATVPHLARMVALHRDMQKQAAKVIQANTTADYAKHDHNATETGTEQSRTNVFQSILSSSLPADEKRRDRIAQEGFILMSAGGETTARTLTTAIYHLLASAGDALCALKTELATVMEYPDSRPNLSVLEQLPWLV
ncbi:MAG: hypothetical protein Q9208_001177 [Pyrenodesmia sp. 3 TL-2023]